jgi:hypothetical protein
MLSDEELALILEGKSKKLEKGYKNRDEVMEGLADLVAEHLRQRNEDYVSRGRLQSQGRASFGRSNEGREGLALFVPDEEEEA